MPNFEVLDQAIEWAERESKKPDNGHWNQSSWVREEERGTSYCIAGYIATQVFKFDPVLYRDGYVLYEPDVMYIPKVVTKELGFKFYELNDLFAPYNDIVDIKEERDILATKYGVSRKWNQEKEQTNE